MSAYKTKVTAPQLLEINTSKSKTLNHPELSLLTLMNFFEFWSDVGLQIPCTKSCHKLQNSDVLIMGLFPSLKCGLNPLKDVNRATWTLKALLT